MRKETKVLLILMLCVAMLLMAGCRPESEESTKQPDTSGQIGTPAPTGEPDPTPLPTDNEQPVVPEVDDTNWTIVDNLSQVKGFINNGGSLDRTQESAGIVTFATSTGNADHQLLCQFAEAAENITAFKISTTVTAGTGRRGIGFKTPDGYLFFNVVANGGENGAGYVWYNTDYEQQTQDYVALSTAAEAVVAGAEAYTLKLVAKDLTGTSADTITLYVNNIAVYTYTNTLGWDLTAKVLPAIGVRGDGASATFSDYSVGIVPGEAKQNSSQSGSQSGSQSSTHISTPVAPTDNINWTQVTNFNTVTGFINQGGTVDRANETQSSVKFTTNKDNAANQLLCQFAGAGENISAFKISTIVTTGTGRRGVGFKTPDGYLFFNVVANGGANGVGYVVFNVSNGSQVSQSYKALSKEAQKVVGGSGTYMLTLVAKNLTGKATDTITFYVNDIAVYTYTNTLGWDLTAKVLPAIGVRGGPASATFTNYTFKVVYEGPDQDDTQETAPDTSSWTTVSLLDSITGFINNNGSLTKPGVSGGAAVFATSEGNAANQLLCQFANAAENVKSFEISTTVTAGTGRRGVGFKTPDGYLFFNVTKEGGANGAGYVWFNTGYAQQTQDYVALSTAVKAVVAGAEAYTLKLVAKDLTGTPADTITLYVNNIAVYTYKNTLGWDLTAKVLPAIGVRGGPASATFTNYTFKVVYEEPKQDDTCEHTGGTATCKTQATCEICGEPYGELGHHTPAEDDGDCTTAVKCTVCDTVTTEAAASHTPAEDDGDCTTAVKCTVCDTVITEAAASHTPAEDDGDCTTAVKCTVCDTVITEAAASHTPAEDDGDCTTAVKCTVCDTVITEAAASHTPAEDDGDCTTAQNCTKCDQVAVSAKEHTGGTATCKTQATCTVCGKPYGDLDPENHVGGTEIRNDKEQIGSADGHTGDTYCLGCGVKIKDGETIPTSGTWTTVDLLSKVTGDGFINNNCSLDRAQEGSGIVTMKAKDNNVDNQILLQFANAAQNISAFEISATVTAGTGRRGVGFKTPDGYLFFNVVKNGGENGAGYVEFHVSNDVKINGTKKSQAYQALDAAAETVITGTEAYTLKLVAKDLTGTPADTITLYVNNIAVYTYKNTLGWDLTAKVLPAIGVRGGPASATFTNYTFKVVYEEPKQDDTCEHTGGTATCKTQATCEICGEPYGELGHHTPAEDDGDCTTAVKCTVCDTVTTEAAASHTPAEDDGDCTTAVKCTVCDTVITEAAASHTPAEDDGDCTTAVKCTVCDTVITEAAASHTPAEDDGDCTTAVKCTVCDTVITEAAASHTPAEDDGDCTTAQNCTKCDQVAVSAKEHTGGTATCKTQATCTVCGKPYGDLDPENHVGGTEIRNDKEQIGSADGHTGDTYCLGCGVKIKDGETIPTSGTWTTVDLLSKVTGDGFINNNCSLDRAQEGSGIVTMKAKDNNVDNQILLQFANAAQNISAFEISATVTAGTGRRGVGFKTPDGYLFFNVVKNGGENGAGYVEFHVSNDVKINGTKKSQAYQALDAAAETVITGTEVYTLKLVAENLTGAATDTITFYVNDIAVYTYTNTLEWDLTAKVLPAIGVRGGGSATFTEYTFKVAYETQE